MHLLVLGGSGFLGRHVVAAAQARGWSVTTFNRGTRHGGTAAAPVTGRGTGRVTDGLANVAGGAGRGTAGLANVAGGNAGTDGVAHRAGGSVGTAGLAHVTGDRTRAADLAPLTASRWDAVIDTWSAAPSAVRDAAAALAPVAGHYVYVSSGSVYADLATGPDEGAPTVAADPDAGSTDYAADKRGAELAAERAFGAGRTLCARAGLILGPGEDVGRLPWWLQRLARGGRVPAPGPPELRVQFVDARDVAAFLLDGAAAGLAGPVNVVGRPDSVSMRDLLKTARDVTGADAELAWVTPEGVAAAGVEPWTELPLWLPPGHAARGLLAMDVTRAHANGLRTRPAAETVADTWAWLQTVGTAPQRPDRPPVGLSTDRERALLAAAS